MKLFAGRLFVGRLFAGNEFRQFIPSVRVYKEILRLVSYSTRAMSLKSALR